MSPSRIVYAVGNWNRAAEAGGVAAGLAMDDVLFQRAP
jgi:hypothetical protein